MAEKLTDLITYALSLAFAAGVIGFAGYKVVALSGMENPPVNMGLNFPVPQRKVIMQGPEAADALTTQSLGSSRRLDGGTGGALEGYDLLTVVDGVAFVAVAGESGKTLVPVVVGSRLPGGALVSDIRRTGGRWSLVAGNLTLKQRLAPLQ